MPDYGVASRRWGGWECARLWNCHLGQGEVGGVIDCRVASWDRGRLGECQTVELPVGTGGGWGSARL